MVSNGSALLFNPGLHLLGGGERYTLALAEVLLDAGYEVTVAGPTLPTLTTREEREFPARVTLAELATAHVTASTRDVDVFVDVTTVAPLRSYARKSIAVVQFPQPWTTDWRSRFHALDYQLVVYSRYVRRWVWRRWRRAARLLAPPVQLGTYELATKEPMILSVGRLFPEFHRKRHDALIDAFALLSDALPWRLVVAGSLYEDEPGARAFLDDLTRRAAGLRVEIRPNATREELRGLYRQASLYWHGSGFGRAGHEPDQVEHFGISVVEAMSYGAVPIVVDDGGLPETVRSGAGRRWRSLEELAAHTRELITEPERRHEMASVAAQRSRMYSQERFAERARRILGLG